MTEEKGYIQRDLKKIGLGGYTVIGIIIMATIAIVIAAVLEHINSDTRINPQKNIYLFLHGRDDLKEKAETALVAYGFSKEKIIIASSENVGKAGDYMAMLWKPPRPDHIKLQKITEVKEVEPEKTFGLWKGVLKKDIDTVLLE
ncbi:MAG: hypothetical protein ACYSTS_14750 [Planctomycetota bacterium]|jgi:hypothetical protein